MLPSRLPLVLMFLAIPWLLPLHSTWCGELDELRRLPPIEPAADLARAGAEPGPAEAPSPSDAVIEEPLGDPLSTDTAPAVEAEMLGPEAESLAWYGWLVPSRWALAPEWDSSFELGIDGSDGNARTFTVRSGADFRRKVDWSDLKVHVTYVRSTADRVETKHNAQLDAHHDWLLGESPWAIFAKTILVYDEFRPFDLELTLNSGLGYRLLQTDMWTLKGRFGSGASRQWDSPDDRWRPEAMLGVDVNCKISERQKISLTSDYYPEWENFEQYRIRTDAGWELLIDEATNMSLKLGLIDRYDTNSGSGKPNAIDYSALLLWKL